MRFLDVDDEELEIKTTHEEEEEEEEEGDSRSSESKITEDEDGPVEDYSDFYDVDDDDGEQVYDEPPAKHAEVDDY
jgi:hypothetical protein